MCLLGVGGEGAGVATGRVGGKGCTCLCKGTNMNMASLKFQTVIPCSKD